MGIHDPCFKSLPYMGQPAVPSSDSVGSALYTTGDLE